MTEPDPSHSVAHHNERTASQSSAIHPTLSLLLFTVTGLHLIQVYLHTAVTPLIIEHIPQAVDVSCKRLLSLS